MVRVRISILTWYLSKRDTLKRAWYSVEYRALTEIRHSHLISKKARLFVLAVIAAWMPDYG